MMHSSFFQGKTKKILVGAISFLLALSLCAAPGLDYAFADVRKADIVLGQTIDSRGLSVAQSPNIEAEYAIVMSADGTVYFERNATSPAQIASITKVMTALVALEYANGDTVVTVSERAASVGESSASLQAGDTLSFDAALKGLMLSSGNDAAIALAETVGAIISGGAVEGYEAEQIFVERMNSKAAEMGLIDTVFSNPHGLDYGIYESDQHSCALDVATMCKVAMENETFRSIVALPNAVIPVTHADGTQGSLNLETTNVLLGTYEGNCGIKTGITNLAGYCFAGATTGNGQELYTVILKAPDENIRFVDTRTLLDWVYEHNISYPLANSTQNTEMELDGQSRTVPVVAEVAHNDWVDKTIKATLADPDQSVTIFDLNGNINQTVEYDTVTGDVNVGDKIGTITFRQRNDVLATVDIIACENVAAPDLFEGIGIWWDRFFKGFSGSPTVADSILINETPLISVKNSSE